MENLYELAKKVKREIENQEYGVEAEIWINQKRHVIALYHDKCISGYYHLEDFYSKNKTVAEIAKEMIEEYKDYQIAIGMQFIEEQKEKMKDFNFAKDKIFCRIENSDILNDVMVPHIKFNDKIIVFYGRIQDNKGRYISYAITEELLEEYGWKIELNKLLEIAKTNILSKDNFEVLEHENITNGFMIKRPSKKNISTIIIFTELLNKLCDKLNNKEITLFFLNDETVFILPGSENAKPLSVILNVIGDPQEKELPIKSIYVYKKGDVV